MALRNRVWIDNQVQGVLIGRLILYWSVGLAYLGLGAACYQYFGHPDLSFSEHAVEFGKHFGLWLPGLILIMPLVIYDIVRLSNFFVGPIYRLRRHLLLLAEDPECHPLTFRKEDFWQDLPEPVNVIQKRILALKQEIAQLRAMQQSADASADPTSMQAPPESLQESNAPTADSETAEAASVGAAAGSSS